MSAPGTAQHPWPRLASAVARLIGRVPRPARRFALAYVAAVLAVFLATWAIGLAQAYTQTRNLSLIYLLVVLWLASVFGRGPAILASVLAFFAYNFFFIAPLHRFTVDDPTEWISLFALLATALVLGQLTASVQARARDAQESQQRTATLFALSQLIAATPEYETLLAALPGRVLDVFAPAGLAACALILADDQHRPVVQAAATASPHGRPLLPVVGLEEREQQAQAGWVLEHGTPAGGHIALLGAGETQPYGAACYFLPLRSRGRIVGVLGIAGADEMRRLVPGASASPLESGAAASDAHGLDPEVELLRAFCEQIALALDRAALQQQAIHAEALREGDRLKDALLGSVTHDLRTPLAAIKAATGSLLDAEIMWTEADRRELLEAIDASADRLNRLVGNLLDLSRLEAGVARPVKEWYLIGDVVAAVLDRLELAGQLAGRAIVVDVPEEMPLAPMDHAQIEQVLTNVLENALKYSPAGSPVDVRARVVGPPEGQPEALEVRITDHGVGVPTGELRAIFGKFYRVRQTAAPWAEGKPPAGTGLGLAISDAIVRAHGGRIWAESRLGEGTTVIFTLPIPVDGPLGGLPELGGEREAGAPEVGAEVAP